MLGCAMEVGDSGAWRWVGEFGFVKSIHLCPIVSLCIMLCIHVCARACMHACVRARMCMRACVHACGQVGRRARVSVCACMHATIVVELVLFMHKVV